MLPGMHAAATTAAASCIVCRRVEDSTSASAKWSGLLPLNNCTLFEAPLTERVCAAGGVGILLAPADAWQGTVLGVLCVAGAKGRSSFCRTYLSALGRSSQKRRTDHPDLTRLDGLLCSCAPPKDCPVKMVIMLFSYEQHNMSNKRPSTFYSHTGGFTNVQSTPNTPQTDSAPLRS